MSSSIREAARTLRPASGDRQGPLAPLMLSLTVLTGVVDGASYLKLGHVFVANMTGNVVFLGFAIAGAKGLSAASSLLALGAFLLGALAGGRVGSRLRSHRGRLLAAAIGTQTICLLAAVAVSLDAADPPHDAARYAMTVVLALAMGLQNAAAQRLVVPELTTTVLTKTLTGLASESSLAGGPGAQAGRRTLAVAAMLAGALAGGLLALDVSLSAALIAAFALSGLIALAALRAARSDAAWTHP